MIDFFYLIGMNVANPNGSKSDRADLQLISCRLSDVATWQFNIYDKNDPDLKVFTLGDRK